MRDTKTMIEVAVVIVVLSLIGWYLVAELAPATTITSPEEASDAVTDVSSDIEDVSSILDDIEQGLG